MGSPAQMGTDLRRAPACLPLHVVSRGQKRKSVPFLAALLAALCLAGVTASAETPLRNSFDSAEMKLMAETNLAYTSCLQEHAREHVASSPDIRVVAGNAAEACEPVLTDLQTALTGNGVNPDFYRGAVARIKNRALRRLLPLLMMEKSSSNP